MIWGRYSGDAGPELDRLDGSGAPARMGLDQPPKIGDPRANYQINQGVNGHTTRAPRRVPLPSWRGTATLFRSITVALRGKQRYGAATNRGI